MTKGAIRALRSTNLNEVQWHERGRDAVGLWLLIIADEQAVLEEASEGEAR